MKATTHPIVDQAEIRTLIPHAGSMCLLDHVLEWNEQSIVCVSQTHRDPANPLRRAGRLSAIHAFEYGAQAVAIHGGLRARASGALAPPGYLAALRDATLHTSQLNAFPSALQVQAEQLFADRANSVYQCSIFAGDTLLAHGRVTIILRDTGKVGRRPVPSPGITSDRFIPSDHPSLAGHFPDEPIVPGVVILDELMTALAQVGQSSSELSRISSVKFLAPLLPEERFAISFDPSPEAQHLDFRCRTADRVIAQGRFELTIHD
ncbi:MAG: hypothetical protein DLM52_03865 [Chthoniobacterales bacterium]|nr:MAG: hypothetical protein DLM52_03865 [Chthoniobacterales bacterium]